MANEDVGDLDVAALRALVDRQAVVDCIHRYARGVDRGDVELVRSAYHPDAVEDHGAYIGDVDGLVDFLASAHAPFPGYQRFVTNTSVDLDGDTAHAESYYLCVLRRDDAGEVLLSGGRYVDRLERRDRTWRIARRVVVVEWEGTAQGGPPRYPVFVAPRRDADDVSYLRPLDVSRERRSPPSQ
ncbi:nuclear transport factor 2 family protein [Dermatobacter hominis]|uniref:nuclear transport factor 2 family protein n=1 Tax=Dermatobacter hominis TaxID=2884263 RepID=UPI001D1119D8|nr:nuclear transport factor 2 family protein [Dermatobacter hominis]UDY36690.1 nuclear transport factor 2 family protein [Dermatobacter hominis]